MHRPTIAQLLTIAACAPVALAGTPDPRDVQIKSIDFDNAILEIYNCGIDSQDLTGWRFCSHDSDQVRRYSSASGLNGVSIAAGSSVFVHFNNDAPADANRLNATTVGSFAVPLDQDAYGMQLFFPDGGGNVSFGNSSLIADHIQWIDAGAAGNAEFRTGQSVSVGLWTSTGDFVSTQADSSRIELIDNTCGTAHGPADYAVVRPFTIHNEAVDGDFSDDASAPTGLAPAQGSNVVEGDVTLSNDLVNGDRDFLTFTVPANTALTDITLLNWAPNDAGFIAVNRGGTGFIPGGPTINDFLAGVLIDATGIGGDVLQGMANASVTTTSLGRDELLPGEYTFVIQQTGTILQSYAMDFVFGDYCPADVNADGSVTPADFTAWLGAFNNPMFDVNRDRADVNRDGDLTPADFTAWLAAFNTGCP